MHMLFRDVVDQQCKKRLISSYSLLFFFYLSMSEGINQLFLCLEHPEALYLSGDGTKNNVRVHLVDDIDETSLRLTSTSTSTQVTSDDFACRSCGLQFSSRNALFKHIRKDHSLTDDTSVHEENSKPHLKASAELINKVLLFFQHRLSCTNSLSDCDDNPRVPVTYLIMDKKLKSAMRMYLRALSMTTLPAEMRYEYESSGWWECASFFLLKQLDECNDFIVHNYDFEQTCNTLSSDVDLSKVDIEWVGFRKHLHSKPDEVPCESLQGNISQSDDDNSLVSDCKREVVTIALDDLPILHRTSSLVFINKPEKIRMETVVECCNKSLRKIDDGTSSENSNYVIKSVSRLDQPTSGVVVLPLSLNCEDVLTNKFKNREVNKYYVCIVLGDVRQAETSYPATVSRDARAFYAGVITTKLKHVTSQMKTFAHSSGKFCETKFCCVQVFQNNVNGKSKEQRVQEGDGSKEALISHSLVVCKPVTGRTHQIRAHMATSGYPLLGDMKYDRIQAKNNSDSVTQSVNKGLSRLMLHSYAIKFKNVEEHTNLKDDQFVMAPLPANMLDACKLLANHHENTIHYDDKDKMGKSFIDYIDNCVKCGMDILDTTFSKLPEESN